METGKGEAGSGVALLRGGRRKGGRRVMRIIFSGVRVQSKWQSGPNQFLDLRWILAAHASYGIVHGQRKLARSEKRAGPSPLI